MWRLVLAILVFVLAGEGSESQAQTWRLDTSWPSGPAVVHTLPSHGGYSRDVFIVFEYARNCDPMMSMTLSRSRNLGAPVSMRPLPYGAMSFEVNGQRYTWYGGEAVYQNAVERSVGITSVAMAGLLRSPRSIVFTTIDGQRIILPTNGISRPLQAAAQHCLSRVR